MNPIIRLPAEVAASVRRRWPERGEIWTRHVVDELYEHCARYNAQPLHVLPARYGLVVAVDTPTGPLVMRATTDPAGPIQAEFARAHAKLGIGPAVHEIISTETGTWTVLDRIIPGYSLRYHKRPMTLIDHLAALFRPMIDQPSPTPNAPHVADWLHRRLTGQEPDDLPPDAAPVTDHERHQALQTLDALRTDKQPGLCHGDAHPDNILIGQGDRLYFIDPRGMQGEVAYDIAVLALKAATKLHADVRHLATAFADKVGVDPEYAVAWVTVIHAAQV